MNLKAFAQICSIALALSVCGSRQAAPASYDGTRIVNMKTTANPVSNQSFQTLGSTPTVSVSAKRAPQTIALSAAQISTLDKAITASKSLASFCGEHEMEAEIRLLLQDNPGEITTEAFLRETWSSCYETDWDGDGFLERLTLVKSSRLMEGVSLYVEREDETGRFRSLYDPQHELGGYEPHFTWAWHAPAAITVDGQPYLAMQTPPGTLTLYRLEQDTGKPMAVYHWSQASREKQAAWENKRQAAAKKLAKIIADYDKRDNIPASDFPDKYPAKTAQARWEADQKKEGPLSSAELISKSKDMQRILIYQYDMNGDGREERVIISIPLQGGAGYSDVDVECLDENGDFVIGYSSYAALGGGSEAAITRRWYHPCAVEIDGFTFLVDCRDYGWSTYLDDVVRAGVGPPPIMTE